MVTLLTEATPSFLFLTKDDYVLDAVLDYRADLRVAIYDLGEIELSWSPLLGIDEFIAQVDEVSAEERERVFELLTGLGSARLRRWLPWLKDQEWTGHTLSLFLGFWELWDQSSEYWVHLQWSPNAKFWFTWINRNCLTLDQSFAIVQSRKHLDPDLIIDPEWLDDWESIDAWIRVKQGFYSFAAFVEYRSKLSYGEDWRVRADFQIDLDTPPPSQGEFGRL